MTLHTMIDRLFARYAARRPMFRAGWGEDELLARFDAAWVTPRVDRSSVLSWSAPRNGSAGAFVRDGRFDAGIDDLPLGAQTAHVRHVGREGNRSVCVLLAGSREEGFSMREAVYGPLVPLGIDLLILENPYYGLRRPLRAQNASVLTVADQVQMNVATLLEAIALLRWAKPRFERCAVAGYSMGGHMAALTGVLYREPIAIGAFATGACPSSIYTRGMLSRSVAFDALDQDGADRLASLFARADLTRLERPVQPRAAALVAMEFDEYVSRAETERLAAHWAGASLRFERAGHVSGILWRRSVLRRALQDALERL